MGRTRAAAASTPGDDALGAARAPCADLLALVCEASALLQLYGAQARVATAASVWLPTLRQGAWPYTRTQGRITWEPHARAGTRARDHHGVDEAQGSHPGSTLARDHSVRRPTPHERESTGLCVRQCAGTLSD